MTNESFFSFRFFMFLCLYYIIENVVVALSASGSFIGIGDDVLLNINHQGTTYYAVYCMISIQHLIRFAKIHSVTVLSSIDRLGQKLVLNRTRNFKSHGPYHPYHPYSSLPNIHIIEQRAETCPRRDSITPHHISFLTSFDHFDHMFSYVTPRGDDAPARHKI